MNEILENIDWMELAMTLWTVVLLPLISYIGTQFYDWLKSKKLDKYADILYTEVIKAVKAVYQDIVDDIKGGNEWTDDKKAEVREIAKQKALNALSNSAYKMLKESNTEFDVWLDNLVGTALYDVKHNKEV